MFVAAFRLLRCRALLFARPKSLQRKTRRLICRARFSTGEVSVESGGIGGARARGRQQGEFAR